MKKTGSFVLDWGTYNETTLVAVGLSYAETVKALKKYGCKKEAIDSVVSHEEDIQKILQRNNAGFFWWFSGKTIRTTILWLNDWEDDWPHYETLIHELFHGIISVLGKERGMIQDNEIEEEAMAYQLEFLFKNCRRELQKLFAPRIRSVKKKRIIRKYGDRKAKKGD